MRLIGCSKKALMVYNLKLGKLQNYQQDRKPKTSEKKFSI